MTDITTHHFWAIFNQFYWKTTKGNKAERFSDIKCLLLLFAGPLGTTSTNVNVPTKVVENVTTTTKEVVMPKEKEIVVQKEKEKENESEMRDQVQFHGHRKLAFWL